VSGGDKLVDAGLGELHEQVPGSSVAAREERTVEAQAWESHHRRAFDVGMAQHHRGERSELRLAGGDRAGQR
jgi:hypothetical protein